MKLCGFCSASKGIAPLHARVLDKDGIEKCVPIYDGPCSICNDKALETTRMIDDACKMLPDGGTFSISTIIPSDWLIREEEIWDRVLANSQSIKNYLNHHISNMIEKGKNACYVSDGDYRVIFDYASGKVESTRNELFVFGRYKKLSQGLSQSRWRCTRCEGKGCQECQGKGKLYVSVEEKVGEPFKKAALADDYVMHASGREDVDATNTAGRAFVMEIKNPKNRRFDLALIASEIAQSGEVSVDDLRIVPRTFLELVTESHFDKTYDAYVEFGREVSATDGEKIASLEGKTLLQQTPKRVAHRRANLVRHRKIKEINASGFTGKHCNISVKAEAGTYIKELISGDGGRTKPSISELLGTTAVCKKLEVTEIDDGYMEFCLEKMKKI